MASLYRLAHDGRLKLKKLEGRTLVETKSLIAVVESANDWTPADANRKSYRSAQDASGGLLGLAAKASFGCRADRVRHGKS